MPRAGELVCGWGACGSETALYCRRVGNLFAHRAPHGISFSSKILSIFTSCWMPLLGPEVQPEFLKVWRILAHEWNPLRQT